MISIKRNLVLWCDQLKIVPVHCSRCVALANDVIKKEVFDKELFEREVRRNLRGKSFMA